MFLCGFVKAVYLWAGEGKGLQCVFVQTSRSSSKLVSGMLEAAQAALMSFLLLRKLKDVTAAVHLSRHIIMCMGILMQTYFIAGN